MIYRNNKIVLISMQLLMMFLILYIPFKFLDVEYLIIESIIVAIFSVLNIMYIFEYFKIDNSRLIYVSRFGFKRQEVCWKDVNKIVVYPDNRFIKTFRIQYGMHNVNEIVINNGVKDYEELIVTVLDKTKNNPGIFIHERVNDIIS